MKKTNDNSKSKNNNLKKNKPLNNKVVNQESPKTFDQLFKSNRWVAGAKKGSIIKAKVIVVDSFGVLVDTGLKSDSTVSIADFKDNLPKVGDEIEFCIMSIDNKGNVVLSSHMARVHRKWQALMASFKDKKNIFGKIMSEINKGYVVDFDGLQGFLPKTQVRGQKRISKESINNVDFEFNILQVDREANSIIVSLVDPNTSHLVKMPNEVSIKEEDVVKGIVVSVESFGVFLDIQGVLGFVKSFDLSWSRINHPSDIMKIGDEIEVLVIRIENNRFRCGIKQLDNTTMAELSERYKVGDVYEGKVVTIINSGLFVLLEGVDGFVDISEVSWNELLDMSSLYPIGTKVKVKVLAVSSNRISLSIKQCSENLFEKYTKELKEGGYLTVSFHSVQKYRILCKVYDDFSAFVEVKDLAWNSGEANEKFAKIKSQIGSGVFPSYECKIVKIDNTLERLQLSVKHLHKDPVERFIEKYPIGSRVEGVVCDLLDRERDSGIMLDVGEFSRIVFVSVNNLSSEREECKVSRFSVGSKVTVKIFKVDRSNRSIFGSVRSFVKEQEKGSSQFIHFRSSSTLGDSWVK